MSKGGSIEYQVLKVLDSITAFGVSKLETRKAIAALAGPDVKYKDVRSPLIHSITTKEDYKKWALTGVDWVREHFGVRKLSQVKMEHVKAWLESRKAQGDSPWTLKLAGAAMAKVLNVGYREFGFDYPPTLLKGITRGRVETGASKAWGDTHPDVRDLGRACGLRRMEMEGLKLEHFVVQKDGSVWLHITKDLAKGGKERDVEPLKDKRSQEVVEAWHEKAKALGQGKRVVGRLSKSYNEHYQRAYYCKHKYQEMENLDRPREFLWVRRDGTVYDKIAMLKASYYGGHGRMDVLVRHYWYTE